MAPVRRYLRVLAALLALLTLSACSALIKLGVFDTIINMGVSVAKTLLVMAIFMHETQAQRLTRMASAPGCLWLAIPIGLSLIDFLAPIPVPPPW